MLTQNFLFDLLNNPKISSMKCVQKGQRLFQSDLMGESKEEETNQRKLLVNDADSILLYNIMETIYIFLGDHLFETYRLSG